MNMTTSAFASRKSSRAKVLPSTDGRRKSGQGVPSGRSRLSVSAMFAGSARACVVQGCAGGSVPRAHQRRDRVPALDVAALLAVVDVPAGLVLKCHAGDGDAGAVLHL